MGYSPRGRKESDLTEQLALEGDQFPGHLSHSRQNFPSLGSPPRPQQPTVLAPFYQLTHSLIRSPKCLLSVCCMPEKQVLPALTTSVSRKSMLNFTCSRKPENTQKPFPLLCSAEAAHRKAPTITPRRLG